MDRDQITFPRYLVVIAFTASVALNIVAAVVDISCYIIPAMLCGWYLADAASGRTHMIVGNRSCPAGRGLSRPYLYERSRESSEYLQLLRKTMATIEPIDRLTYDFKDRHPRPDALGRRTMWRQIGSTVVLAALPASLLLNLGWWFFEVPGEVMTGGCALILGCAFAQYFHGTLHRDNNPWIVRAMRGARLLMTPAAHSKHHETLQRDSSTNCGWPNPLVKLIFRVGRGSGHFSDEGLEPHR